MSHLFETIKILDGKVQNLYYHNLRCNSSRAELFNTTDNLNLEDFIKIPRYFQKGLVKCRISFEKNVDHVQFAHYQPRTINSLKIVKHDQINYQHKYEDRSVLKALFQTRQGNSEIIIVKNGLLTDCFYYNIALQKDDKWYTPKIPLLRGTMRSKLLKEEKIIEKDIRQSEIKNYKKIALFNALTNLGEIVLESEMVN